MLPLLVIFTSNIFANQFPNVQVTSWSNSETYTWDTTSPVPSSSSSNDTVLVIPSTVGGIVLTCNASFPIEWNIHHEQLYNKKNGRSHAISLISTTRKSDDIFQPKTFLYITELTLLGDSTTLTGNYTCQSADEEEDPIGTSLYIFWEGISPPFLIYAGENRSVVYDNGVSSNAILPCKISRPDITVVLFKYIENDWIKINETLFDPSIGFTLSNTNTNPNNTMVGQYKCVANNEDDKDFVIIHVMSKDKAPKPYEFKNYLRRPATFIFNTNKTQFICCSNSGKPPKLMHLYCDHPITCKLKKNALADIENNGKNTGSGCSMYSLFMPTSGILRCVGDGVDIIREYFFPMGFQYGFRYGLQNISPPYYNWENADPDKMLALNTRATAMYVGQNISFNCQISKYYFSRGGRWMISWKNQTNLVVPEVIKNQTTRRSAYRQYFRQNIISITISADIQMNSITCFAPVWNTTEWKNKSLTLNIEEPIIPKINGDSITTIEWYLNDTDKQLNCDSIGKPLPFIRWKKDNHTTYYHTNIKITTVNSTSILKVTRVSYEHHGTYTCSCSNFAGTSTKTFQVIVSERTHSGTIIAIVISIIVGVIVMIGVAILVLRLKAQKTVIRQLANAAFKDFESPTHQQIIKGENMNDNITQQVVTVPIPDMGKYHRM